MTFFVTIAKSPAFTHLAATLSGLSTVRAYKVSRIMRAEFDNHQDMHSACWFLFISTNFAFSLSLDAMCCGYISFMLCFFMFINTNVPGEKVGLAITQAMTLVGIMIIIIIHFMNEIAIYHQWNNMDGWNEIRTKIAEQKITKSETCESKNYLSFD